MGDVLAELEGVLRKSNRGKISPQEELVLQTCKSKAIRYFTFGFCASSAIVWTATRRFAQVMRFNLSLGSAMFFGMWSFDKSLVGCLDQIMAVEGSRIQRELANIILTKHENDRSRMMLVSKYFYPERVFNDQHQDKPIFRWQLRNVYKDSTSRRTEPDGSSISKVHDINKQPPNQTNSPVVGVGDAIADPLDCIFGFPETIVEMSESETAEVPRRRMRTKKKGSRRHRSNHSETTE